MPNEFSLDNLPTGIIYKSQEDKEEAIKAGNLALSKGQSIDQAEFAASSAVKRLIKQRRGSDTPQVGWSPPARCSCLGFLSRNEALS